MAGVTRMSRRSTTKRDLIHQISTAFSEGSKSEADMTGFSFELPTRLFAELKILSTLSRTPMSHYAREALLAYMTSPDVKSKIRGLMSENVSSPGPET